jgi:hypothetical protein
MAPHGVGRPPKAHVRRGSAKEPLTMRDLHNLFWESRTRQERVQQLRSERREFLLELERKKQAGRLVPSAVGKPISDSMPHLAFRCTVIPETPLELRGIAANLRDHPLEFPSLRRTDGSHVEPLFGWGQPQRRWQPKAHSARAEQSRSRAFGLWTVGDDGLVDITGLSLSTTPLITGILLVGFLRQRCKRS